mmetsp:Transcript_91007/g.167105  ORF Transcript_91007/g.167105 Transcript_91007/m.167105 type:complete len:166 (-) Transcript_91007:53-550(-)
MAGISEADKLDQAKSAEEAQGICNLPGILYARVFAESGPRGAKEKEAYGEIVKSYGEGRASSLNAICWFLHWGSFTGNTLNGILGFKEKKEGMSLFFKTTFVAYYGPLFYGLINIVSLILKPVPKPVPTFINAGFGAVLATIAGSFFTPLGVVGKVIDAKLPLRV